jgi:hypothetical protein
VGPDTFRCLALQLLTASGSVSPASAPPGYGPSSLRSAYKVTQSGSSAITVAIVDAYDMPYAEEDLAAYRSQFGLPPCTTANGCFRRVDQRGGTSYPEYDYGWGSEIDLDTQMVSAICPNCHILVVEADSDLYTDLAAAEERAAAMGATVISNSFGGPESSYALAVQSSFDHPGTGVFASSGDWGYEVDFPASSQHVIAVGGTSLSTAANARGWTESAWSWGGSGCSSYMSKPVWQMDLGCANRTVADVAAVADPNTGVAMYDPDYGGWGIWGGTSASAPIVATIAALAKSADSAPYMAGDLYANASTLFDVTSGSNGSCSPSYLCAAGTGYDGPTGLGTPNGIESFVAPAGQVRGTLTASGSPRAGLRVVATAPSVQVAALTAADGSYSLRLRAGSYTLAFSDPSGIFQSGYYSDSGFTRSLASATSVTVGTGLVNLSTIDLPPNPTISGTITGPGSIALGGIAVTATGSGSPISAMTNANGTYTLRVPPDSYVISVSDPALVYAPGYYSGGGFTRNAESATLVDVTGSSADEIDVEMPLNAAITGMVTDVDGPAAGISVTATASSTVGHAMTGADGTYELRVPAGTYVVSFSDPSGNHAAGFYSASGFTSIRANATPVVVDLDDVLGIGVQLPVAHSTPFLDMQSAPGEFIGAGQTWHYDPTTAYMAGSGPTSTIALSVGPWAVHFGAPSGQELVAGTYSNASSSPSRTADQPYISIWGNGRACNATGSFVVLVAERDPHGSWSRFDATFVQYCDGLAPALTGEINYVAPASIVVSPAEATVLMGVGQTFTDRARDAAGRDLGDVTVVSSFTLDGNACYGNSCRSNDPGDFEVRATFGSMEAMATLHVVPPTTRIRGVVSDAGGTHLSGITVAGVSSNLTFETTTDAGGAYALPATPGIYAIYYFDPNRVYQPGFYGASGFTPSYGSAMPVVMASSDVTGLDVKMPPAQAQTGSFLRMQGQAGDYVLGPLTYEYSPSTEKLSASNSGSHAWFYVANAKHWWYLDLVAPNGQQLTPGLYLNATRYPFQDPSDPGLNLDGDGRGCNTLTGTFTVLAADYAPNGALIRFDATFVQHCDGATAAAYGEISYIAPASLTLSPASATVLPGVAKVYHAEGSDAQGADVGDWTGAATFKIDGSNCSGSSCQSTIVGDHTITGTWGTITGSAVLHVSATGTAPSKPTRVSAIAGDTVATVSWSAPSDDGGLVITGYAVTSSPDSRSCAWTAGPLSCTVSGLTNGIPYTFTVTATNSVGTGDPSDPSTSVTPAGLPGAPTSVTALAGNASATVWWTAPAWDGGSAISSYAVTSLPDAKTCGWTSSVGGQLSCTVTGLTNGQAYVFSVTASNSAYTGPASAASNSVTPAGPPGAPTGVTALAGNRSADVSWFAPVTNGGRPITGYTVTAVEDTARTCTTTGDLHCRVAGLSNRTAYTFTVTATNGICTGPASAPSPAVSPHGGSSYYPVAPYRVMDSRYAIGAVTFHSRAKQTVNIATADSHVPSGATAVTGNLTITGQTGAGYVTVAPSLTSGVQPPTSTLNFPLGDTRANGVTVPLAFGAYLDFMYWSSSTTSTVNVIFDVTGFFYGSSTLLDLTGEITGSSYYSVTPHRVMDSRYNIGAGIYHSRTKQQVKIATTKSGVPDDATAVTGNLTVTSQTRQGYVTVAPSLTSKVQPPTSTLNFPVKDTRANNVTVPLAAGGYLDFMYWSSSTADTVQVIFDVTGYFEPNSGGSTYYTVTPYRVMDSRYDIGAAKYHSRARQTVLIATTDSQVPADATAVTGNLTVTGQTRQGYITVAPSLTSGLQPPTSTLNFPYGDTRANGVDTPLATGGYLDFMYWSSSSADTVQVIFDVTGYFAE